MRKLGALPIALVAAAVTLAGCEPQGQDRPHPEAEGGLTQDSIFQVRPQGGVGDAGQHGEFGPTGVGESPPARPISPDTAPR
jgi:hypothetical protein